LGSLFLRRGPAINDCLLNPFFHGVLFWAWSALHGSCRLLCRRERGRRLPPFTGALLVGGRSAWRCCRAHIPGCPPCCWLVCWAWAGLPSALAPLLPGPFVTRRRSVGSAAGPPPAVAPGLVQYRLAVTPQEYGGRWPRDTQNTCEESTRASRTPARSCRLDAGGRTDDPGFGTSPPANGSARTLKLIRT